MATKPTAKSIWTVGNGDFATVTQEPTATKKEPGWLVNERPPREFMNWLFWIHGQWIEYLEEVTDEFAAGWDIVVGSAPGMVADLQTAINAASVGDRILVTEGETVDTRILIDKSGIEIYFKPGINFTKGTATKCFEITGDRVLFKNGRIAGGFTIGIDVTASASYTRIRDFLYSSITTPVQDNGTLTSDLGGIEE